MDTTASTRKFTMNLATNLHAHLMRTSLDAGVTGSDTIRALLILRARDAELAERTLQLAQQLHTPPGPETTTYPRHTPRP